MRARWERERTERLKTISFSARVLKDRSPVLVKQADVVEMTKVSAQTLRNYVRRGMRVYGTPTRPLYQLGDVCNWMAYANMLRETHRPKDRIEQDEATQHMLQVEARGDPAGYVVVPVHHDHPQREYWLRKAAEGAVHSPTLDELTEHYADEDDRIDQALPHDHDNG